MEFIIDGSGKLKEVKKVSFLAKKIQIPEGVTSIGDSCFFNYRNIEEIILPSTIKSIGNYAFQNCTNLNKINLPENIKIIGEYAFENCKNLLQIKLPSSINKINNYTFFGCKSLQEIIIPNSVKIINYKAFSGCTGLNKITLPKELLNIDEHAFYETNNIETLIIDNQFLLNNNSILKFFDKLKHVYNIKKTRRIILSKNETKNLEEHKIEEYVLIKNYMKCDTNIAIILSVNYSLKEIKVMKSLKQILPTIIIENFNEKKPNILHSIKNNKEYELMFKYIFADNEVSISTSYSLFKLAYILGGFEKDKEQRQKATEFIKNAIEKNILTPKSIERMTQSITLKSYNEEWSEFFMNKNNFIKLIELENQNYEFISKTYNEFDDLKEFGRSNRGSQAYRKITVEMCETYLNKLKFKGINETNIDIAEETRKYTRRQTTFDTAITIRDEYLTLKKANLINDHIVDEEIKEDIFSIINEERKLIIHGIDYTLNRINNSFTYEFLSKYDPKNYFLGKYCSCCSHLEGEGIGIVRATILHPECQNIIIRDENGKIVSKSTLYINKKERYVILNNIELSDIITSKEDKKIIYLKYLKALEHFTSIYNKKNPTNTIRQINVGMGRNDLENEIKNMAIKAKKKLNGIDFKKYNDDFGHEGDWQQEQYMIWRNQEWLYKKK